MRKYTKVPKYILFILLVVASLNICSQAQAAEKKVNPPKVSAHAYVVMDANSGEILFSENKDKIIYPASTVKLMTAIVVAENEELSKKIKVKASVLKEIESDASTVGLRAGNTYTVEQLLNLLLVASAADAADTLAVANQGSTKDFVKQMNKRAEQMGLSHTSFDNTIGLDIGNGYNKTYSTATEIAELARYAMSIKAIRDIVSKKTYTVKNQLSVRNTNRFYSTISYNTDRYTIIGTKTGTTNAAGHVLVSTARDEQGHEIICAFFGNESKVSTYEDTRKLFDYTFRCQDEEKLCLSLSYYDVRYRDSESAILEHCTEGILQMPENGEFHPTEKVKQQDFVDIINQICNTNLEAIDEDKYITAKSLASILYNSYPIDLQEYGTQESMDQIEAMDSLTQEEVIELIALFDAQILPDQYINNIKKCITKEDMILIAGKLKDYIKAWKKMETKKAS